MKTFSNVVLSTKNIDDLIVDLANEVVGKIMELGLTEPKPNIGQKSKDLITRKEALKLLGVSTTTLWRWENQGKIKSYGVGGKRYFKQNELMESLTLLNR